jgi:2,4'-dihydroxyacetophenone dioxygenase
MTLTVEPVAGSLDVDDIPWMGEHASISIKMLRIDPVGGEYTVYTRMDAGTVLPRHRHFGPVDAWTIKGEWGYLEYDWTASRGSYVHERPGATHTLKVGDDGEAIVLFIVRGGLQLLGEGDEILGYEDFETMRDRYVAVITADGHAIPEFLT